MNRALLLLAVLAMALSLVGSPALAQSDDGPSGDIKGRAGAEPAPTEDAPARTVDAPAPPSLADGMRASRNDGRMAGAASSTPQWLLGPFSSTHWTHPVTLITETLTMEWVGYYGAQDGSYPMVGDLYYGGVIVGAVGTVGTPVVPEVVLPPNTFFAIDPNDPNRRIRCFWENTNNGQSGEFPASECPQEPEQGQYGVAFYQPFEDQAVWNLPPGWSISIQFPVISTAVLKGIAASPADCLMGAIWAARSHELWDAPEPGDPHCAAGSGEADGAWQGVFVAPNPPTIGYPNPSATNVTQTGARTTAHLFNHYAGGTAFFDLGTTTAYGESLSVTFDFHTGDGFEVFADWSDLTPGTTYHWRLRFVDRQGRVYRGADQTFRTADPPPDTTAPRVRRVVPAENATDVKPGVNVSVSFSEEMKATTVSARTVKLFKKGSRTALPAAVRYDATAKKAILDPSAPLERGATYKATVSTGVRDLAGNPLAQAKTWTFTVRT